MIPVTWPEFGALHPFAPAAQAEGYRQLFAELELMLREITGFDAISLQPNAGSQGEYAGLLTIRAYHRARGEGQRDICLIPSSAHGTNPASATMAGLQVVVVSCDQQGNVDLADLRAKAEQHKARLAALMITYPSTHGVFEEAIREICATVHDAGGQVYLDGANLNALVGDLPAGRDRRRRRPSQPAQDLLHPARRRRPGHGPDRRQAAPRPVPAGPRGRARRQSGGEERRDRPGVGGALGIALDPADLLGLHRDDGRRRADPRDPGRDPERQLRRAPPGAPLSDRLQPARTAWSRTSASSTCGRSSRATGVTVEDVAKRLIDYGFHAPTMSWPVPETLMIEPTESEAKRELDRFCDAMIGIRKEIAAIEQGLADAEDNLLKNAPHTADVLLGDWPHDYARQDAFFPVPALRESKYWPPVGRVDNVYGDRHLVCSCPPIEAYREAAE